MPGIIEDIGGMPFDAKRVVDFITEEVTYDRQYPARDFADYFASFIGNGVFANPSDNYKVLTAGFMSLGIRPGKAWINGYYTHHDEITYLFIPTAPNTGFRKDRVVLRLNLADRTFQLAIKEGTPHATNPQPPALERYSLEQSGDWYELGLAIVTVRAGVVTVTQDDILDTRLNTNDCGIVHALIEQVDTTDIWDQYYSYWQQQQQAANDWATTQINLFTQYANTKKSEMDKVVFDAYTIVNDLRNDGFEKVALYKYYTMQASKWSNKQYDFTDYPANLYNISIQPSEKCTLAQLEAWGEAKIVGNVSANKAIAYGDVPTIDIPIILKYTLKFGVQTIVLNTEDLTDSNKIKMVTPTKEYDIDNMVAHAIEAQPGDMVIHPDGEELISVNDEEVTNE